RSKMLMEVLVNDLARTARNRKEAFETVLIRPPWFYGPNQPPRQTLFFRMIRDGKMPIVGSGQNLRSMGYVDNLCQGLLLAATAEAAGGRNPLLGHRGRRLLEGIGGNRATLRGKEVGRKIGHKPQLTRRGVG